MTATYFRDLNGKYHPAIYHGNRIMYWPNITVVGPVDAIIRAQQAIDDAKVAKREGFGSIEEPIATWNLITLAD